MVKKTCLNGHKYTGDKCSYCPDPDSKTKPVRKTRFFGTTIQETLGVLKPAYASRQVDKATLKHDRKVIIFRIVLSAAVLFAAVACIVAKEQSGTGIGLLGTVIGYWLK